MALELYLISLGVILRVCDLGLPDKYLRFLFGTLEQIFLILLRVLKVNPDDKFLRMVRANKCLQVHESIPHVFVLRFE